MTDYKKLYIYDYVEDITSNWHSGGGVLIVTAGDPLEAFNADADSETIKQLPPPVRVIDVPDSEADLVQLFPGAGCC